MANYVNFGNVGVFGNCKEIKNVKIVTDNNNISCINGKLFIDGKPYDNEELKGKEIVTITIEGNAGNVTSGVDVVVNGSVEGHISSSRDIEVRGNVVGDISAGRDIEIGRNVTGNIKAGRDIEIEGDCTNVQI